MEIYGKILASIGLGYCIARLVDSIFKRKDIMRELNLVDNLMATVDSLVDGIEAHGFTIRKGDNKIEIEKKKVAKKKVKAKKK